MNSFDGWDARVKRSGASMMSRDAPGWAMTYQGGMSHGGAFGRGHYRGDRTVTVLAGSRGYARAVSAKQAQKKADPAYGSSMITGDVLKNRNKAQHSECYNGFEWRSDELAHFRTKGSKNGVRRYQTEDGTWTPLGLKERRAREGFGERKAARQEARTQRKAARAEERSRRAEAMRQYVANQKKKNPKNMTDDELRSGIERLKMEQEYRELNKNPLLKTAEKVYENYTASKAAKAKAEAEQYQRETNRINALSNLKKSQADNRNSKANLLDTITGTNRKKASAELKKVKNETRKHTIGGAIQQAVHDILSKEGNRIVREMGDESFTMKNGRKAKSVVTKALNSGKKFVKWQINKNDAVDSWVQSNVVQGKHQQGARKRGKHEA